MLTTPDGQFTRIGSLYYRARDEIKGAWFRCSPWARIGRLERRLREHDADLRRRRRQS